MAMLALGGCGEKKADKAELDRIDAQLGGKVKTDPLLAQALEDQIMVDPNLTQQANEHSTRAPDTPFAAQVPLDAPLLPAGGPGQTLGARAAIVSFMRRMPTGSSPVSGSSSSSADG